MKKLFLLFFYVCFLANAVPLFFPSLQILVFVPFLVLSLYRSSLNQALWWSLICGFILDLFSSQTGIGTYAFNYALTTFCLYGYKTHFFEDRLSTLPVVTFCYTCFSGLIQSCLMVAIGNPFLFSWDWFKLDLFFIPLQTSLFSVAAFSGPVLLFAQLKKRLMLYRKRNNPG